MALLNFFLPNLEMILTLRWLNFMLFTYIFASWKHYSAWVIYEEVQLDSRTPLTFFFSLCPKNKIHIFSPLGKFYLTPHHHHSTLTRKTDLLHCQTQQGKNVQRINGRLFIRYNCLLIRRESSFPLVILS